MREKSVCFGVFFSFPLGGAVSFELPQVVVDGDGVHTGGDRLGRDDGKLLAV